jgi:signal transduction histidine kinase
MQQATPATGTRTQGRAQTRAGVARPVVVAAALLIVAFAGFYSWLSWQREKARELAFMASVAEVTAKSLDAYFVNLGNQLAILGADLVGEDGSFQAVDATRLLARFRQNNPGIRPVNVTSVDGRILATTEPGPAPLPTLAGAPNFIEARAALLAGRNTHVSRPFLGVVTGGWVVAVRQAVRDKRGRLQFTVGAGLPVDHPQSFWNEAPLPPGAAVGLIRDDGYLVSRYPLPQGATPAQAFSIPVAGGLAQYLPAHPLQKNGVVEGGSSITGRQSLYAFRRLEHFPVTAFINNPVGNVWAAWWQEVTYFYTLLVVCLLVGLAGVAWARRRQLAWEADRDRYIAGLEAANAELNVANTELESFSYTVSHDLRAPLRAIDGFAAMLDEDLATAPPEEARALLARVRAASQHMGRLIDALLVFAQNSRQPLDKQAIDMEALVRAVLAEEFPRHGVTELKIGPLPPAQADPVLIRQVWLNLIDNAWKYSANAAHPLIEIGHAEGRYFVRDNGVGFDMLYAAQLFGVFKRLHNDKQYDGVGIGLATVERIVQRHGGRVYAEGKVGEGARFSFTLGEAG